MNNKPRIGRLSLLMLAPVVVLAAACGQPVAGEPQAEQVQATKTSKPSARPSKSTRPTTTSRRPTSTTGSSDLKALVGTWEGEYTCGQGETGLKLTIEAPRADSLPATFEFFPLPENPQAKAGSYSMVGSSSGGRLVFRQQKWIDQPSGYMMVDLAVTSPVEEEAETLSGDVLSDNCKGFSVRRK